MNAERHDSLDDFEAGPETQGQSLEGIDINRRRFLGAAVAATGAVAAQTASADEKMQQISFVKIDGIDVPQLPAVHTNGPKFIGARSSQFSITAHHPDPQSTHSTRYFLRQGAQNLPLTARNDLKNNSAEVAVRPPTRTGNWEPQVNGPYSIVAVDARSGKETYIHSFVVDIADQALETAQVHKIDQQVDAVHMDVVYLSKNKLNPRSVGSQNLVLKGKTGEFPIRGSISRFAKVAGRIRAKYTMDVPPDGQYTIDVNSAENGGIQAKDLEQGLPAASILNVTVRNGTIVSVRR